VDTIEYKKIKKEKPSTMSEKKEEYDPKLFKVNELIFPKGDSWKYYKEIGEHLPSSLQ